MTPRSLDPPSPIPFLGDALRLARLESGKTQVELAEACRVTQGAVSSWETGSKTPALEHLVPAARFLSLAPSALLGLAEGLAERAR